MVFVSWHEAVAYCRWLLEREGAEVRPSTEAEWEYACWAGSSTPFSSGDELAPGVAKNQRRTSFPDRWRTTGENVVPLQVGRTAANSWGLFDMLGNVEEWLDWYGPYLDRDASDPTGPPGCADYPVPPRPARKAPVELHGTNVLQTVLQTTAPEASGADDAPFFRGPIRYVRVPPRSYGPLFSTHNHDPAICQCPNGDLLAIWIRVITRTAKQLGRLIGNGGRRFCDSIRNSARIAAALRMLENTASRKRQLQAGYRKLLKTARRVVRDGEQVA